MILDAEVKLENVAGRRLHVTYMLKQQGTMIRVISARPMSRKERNAYAEK